MKEKGFALIILLIAVLILVLLSLGIYQSFFNNYQASSGNSATPIKQAQEVKDLMDSRVKLENKNLEGIITPSPTP